MLSIVSTEAPSTSLATMEAAPEEIRALKWTALTALTALTPIGCPAPVTRVSATRVSRRASSETSETSKTSKTPSRKAPGPRRFLQLGHLRRR